MKKNPGEVQLDLELDVVIASYIVIIIIANCINKNTKQIDRVIIMYVTITIYVAIAKYVVTGHYTQLYI